MSAFKIGDFVRITGPSFRGCDDRRGEVAKVTRNYNDGDVGVTQRSGSDASAYSPLHLECWRPKTGELVKIVGPNNVGYKGAAGEVAKAVEIHSSGQAWIAGSGYYPPSSLQPVEPEAPAKPAEPKFKVGDWVRITSPSVGGHEDRIGDAVKIDGPSLSTEAAWRVRWHPSKGGFLYEATSLEPWTPKPGEWVRVIGESTAGNRRAPIGTVTTAKASYVPCEHVINGWAYPASSLEPAEEPKAVQQPKPEPKVGDRVKAIGPNWISDPENIGKEGEAIDRYSDGDLLVRFDNGVQGYYKPANLEVVERPKPKPEPRFKRGDFVRILKAPLGAERRDQVGKPGIVESLDGRMLRVRCFGGGNHPDGGGYFYLQPDLEPWQPKVGDFVEIIGPSRFQSDEHAGKVGKVERDHMGAWWVVSGYENRLYHDTSLRPTEPAPKFRAGDVVRIIGESLSGNKRHIGEVCKVRPTLQPELFDAGQFTYHADSLELAKHAERFEVGKCYHDPSDGEVLYVVGKNPLRPACECNLVFVDASAVEVFHDSANPDGDIYYEIPLDVAKAIIGERNY